MTRGTHLPTDWQPDDTLCAWVFEHYNINSNQLALLVEEFVDYWAGVPGTRGTKRDWPATFRNRCRQVFARYRRLPGQPRNSGSTGVVL